MRSLALRGSLWTIFSFIVSQGLRVLSNLLLTRLLFPEAFGMMTVVNVFIVGLQMFSDLGVGPAVIQSSRSDSVFLNTAWTVQILRGLALWAICCVLAWPVAVFYGEPQLLYLLPVVGFGAVVSGFQSTELLMANRSMKLRRVTMLQLGGQVISIFMMVAWALVHPSVWALAGSGVVSGAVSVALGFYFLPTHRHRISFDGVALGSLLRYGRWILLSTACTFFADQGIRLLEAHLLPIQTLGCVAIAVSLAWMATTLAQRLSSVVLFPVLSQVNRDDASKVGDGYRKAKRHMMVLAVPAHCALILWGDTIATHLYDARYADVARFLPIIAITAAIETVRSSYGSVFLATGKPQYGLVSQAVKAVVFWGATFVGFRWGGVDWMLWATAGANLLMLCLDQVLLSKCRVHSRWEDLMSAACIATAAVATTAM